MSKFEELCKNLESKIQNSYTIELTLEDAEKLAGEFLFAQLAVSAELKKADLDSRMRRSGVKSVRAAIYMESATKDVKKPSDVMLEAIVNLNDIVQKEQNSYDSAEVDKENLNRYFGIFQNAHIFFRGIAKGKFE